MSMTKTKNYLQSQIIAQTLKSRLKQISSYAEQAGIPVYVVGGFVRDLMLKRIVWDMDIVSEKDPSPLLSMIKGKIIRYSRYMTYTVTMNDGTHIDFSTARKETYAHPAALPVVHHGSLKDDLYRRDFTCNAMAIQLNNPHYGALVDPFNGAADLKKNKLKVFHARSFDDDPTRIFRAARFMGRYGFTLENNTDRLLKEAIKKNIPVKLSPQRKAHEFIKIISEDNPDQALDILKQWGALRFIHPLVSRCTWKKITVLNRTPEFNLAWFLQDLMPDNAEHILESLCIDRKTTDAVMSILSAAQVLQSKKHIHDSMLDELRDNNIYNIDFMRNYPGIDRSVIAKLENYRAATSAFLNGADLHSLGYLPGKSYGEMLKSLRRRIWEGKLKKRQDSILFLKKKFKNRD